MCSIILSFLQEYFRLDFIKNVNEIEIPEWSHAWALYILMYLVSFPSICNTFIFLKIKSDLESALTLTITDPSRGIRTLSVPCFGSGRGIACSFANFEEMAYFFFFYMSSFLHFTLLSVKKEFDHMESYNGSKT